MVTKKFRVQRQLLRKNVLHFIAFSLNTTKRCQYENLIDLRTYVRMYNVHTHTLGEKCVCVCGLRKWFYGSRSTKTCQDLILVS